VAVHRVVPGEMDSVAGLLPPTTSLSKSRLQAVWAYSPRSVWAVGTGGREDEGGPTVVLHYNGHAPSSSTAPDPALDREPAARQRRAAGTFVSATGPAG
jgi:hypothetical protein